MAVVHGRTNHHINASILLLCLVPLGPFNCASSQSLLRNHKENQNGIHHQHLFVTRRESILSASANPTTPHLNEHEQQKYQQQNQRIVQQDAGNNIECSLCQGVPLLADKILDFEDDPDETCLDKSISYQSEMFAAILDGPNTQASCPRDQLDYAFDRCCKASIPQYECETNIQNLLFNDAYNSVVPPFTDSENPLIIPVFLQYEALEDIDVEAGTATVFISLSLKWIDPRLKWDVENDTCSNVIDVFTGQEQEQTMIWLPDFDLYRQIEGTRGFPNRKASVYSDGTVQWTIYGGLKVLCSFTGLAAIPFDILGCQLIMGEYTRKHSSKLQFVLVSPDIVPYNSVFEVTYNEWQPVPELATHGMLDGNMMYVNFFFQRATSHYISNIVVPTIILTYLSFFTFLLDFRVGERLGFCMALALVIVTQQIVTSDLLPVSNQRLWLRKFTTFSFYWVFMSVIQSVLVVFLYYIRVDHQAKKESINIELMHSNVRGSIMLRAVAAKIKLRGVVAAAIAEEERMLPYQHDKEQNIPPETLSLAVEAPEEQNSLTQQHDEAQSVPPVSLSSPQKVCWFYTFGLRKFDLFCFVFAVVTYTAFIVFMFMTSKTKMWLRNEPKWFGEDDA